MAGMKKITISDENALRALNLMATMTNEDATDIATRAVLDLWEEKAEGILEKIHQFSPLKGHLNVNNGAAEEEGFVDQICEHKPLTSDMGKRERF